MTERSSMTVDQIRAERLPYATWGTRFKGRFLDGVVLLPGTISVFVGRNMSDNAQDGSSAAGSTLVVLGLIYIVLVAMWNEVVRQGRTGQSVGKQWAGTCLVSPAEIAPLGERKTFLRYLAHVLDTLPLYLGYLWPIWDGKRQTFADKIVGSVVLVGTPDALRDKRAAAREAALVKATAVPTVEGSGRDTLLQVAGLCVNYGHIEAIRDITFSVEEGTITTLIGANGAGKTTTLKTISGLRKVRSGQILFEGEDISLVPPYERVMMGISQSPEGRGCFPGMTVRENLDMGAYVRRDRRTAAYQTDLDRVFDLFPRLKEREKQAAGSMSGGEQQMLAIGRALMAKPRLLLLDEPSMGLAPKLIQQIFTIITEINTQGTTVLLVEQNAAQALKRAHYAHILETGEIVKSGTGKELSTDDSVKAAYLGGDV